MTLAETGDAGPTKLGMSRCRHGRAFGQIHANRHVCCSDVTQATPPKVSIASITRDAAGIESFRYS